MNKQFNNRGQFGQSPNSKNKNNNKNGKNNKNDSREVGLYIPLHPSDIMPPRIVKTFNYIDDRYTRNNSGALYLVYSFRVNDLYDPDPLILSGGVSGFKEMMQFYTTYRVLSTKIHLKIANLETFPLIYGYVFGQTSLAGVVSGVNDAVNALENDFSTRGRLLAAKGGIDTDEIQSNLNMGQLLGTHQQYRADISYSGQGLASPITPLWVNLIIASTNTTNLINGVATALTFEFNTEFFGRTNLRA